MEEIDKADEIISGLWLGGYNSALDLQCGVGCVLTICEEVPFDSGERGSIKMYNFEVLDECTPEAARCMKGVIDSASDIIDDYLSRGIGVLVRCLAGRSRSPTVVIGYLIKKKGMSLGEAFWTVKLKRTSICLNPVFFGLLQDIESSVSGSLGLQ
jgi:hypothetical protein